MVNAKKQETDAMGKTRDLFNHMRDTKGTFHVKMGSMTGRNGMGLTGADGVEKRCKNTQNCTKKTSMTQVTTML